MLQDLEARIADEDENTNVHEAAKQSHNRCSYTPGGKMGGKNAGVQVTWRITPVSTWFITMAIVSSPKDRVVGPLPNHLSSPGMILRVHQCNCFTWVTEPMVM